MITGRSFEKATLVFPPSVPAKRPQVRVSLGDPVRVRGRQDLGTGRVIDLEPDGRLVKCEFDNREGWWKRVDLVKA